MIKHWIIFIGIALFFPIFLPLMKAYAKSRLKKEPNSETEKLANIKVLFYVIFYWICDLFYMSCFLNNITYKYIFGILIIVLTFINLSKIVSLPKEKSFIESFGLTQDFILGTAITIYLIYLIPNENLKNIVIPIVAAIYGGLITLAGVSLTIKKSDKDRKDDEIKKAKPLVFVVDEKTINYKKDKPLVRVLPSEKQRGDLNFSDKINKYYTLPFVALDNFDFSHTIIIGFRVNNKHHLYDVYQVLPKNTLMFLYNDFKFTLDEEIQYVALLLKDLMDNIYELQLKFNIETTANENKIEIESNLDTIHTTLNLNAKEI